MEAILKNSINSTVNTSEISNLSTARLLIDHIKRVVEDDMMSTVEAFRSIESEIDNELKSTVSTIPKKTFAGNRISRSRSYTSNPQPQRADKRISLQPNYRVPSAAGSKRNMRKSLIGKPVQLDTQFESDNTIEEISNCDIYNSPHLQQKILHPEDYQEFQSMPEAASTPVKNPYSFPSIGETQSVPSREQSASTITNPNSYQNDNQSYSDNSKLLTVEAMYHDLKADLNRIFKRFVQESNETNSPIRAASVNNNPDPPRSLFHDQTSQTSCPSSTTNSRHGRGIVLPQLLAFGDNWNNNRRNGNVKGGFTVISEPFTQSDRNDRVTNELTDKMNGTLSKHSSWVNGFKIEEKGTLNRLGNESKTTEEADIVHRKLLNENSNTTSQKPTDSEGEYMNTVDLNVMPEQMNGNNYVTLTDIDESIPETVRDDDGLTSICSESKATNNISTSLIATPKTTKESSNSYPNLDDIALLISQASPNQRVVIKKIVPNVAVKGYNRNCNEKLIFCGDKVTHVKTDRKTICRNFDPK